MGKKRGSRESFGIGTFTTLFVGTGLGMAADAMWYSFGLPGSTTPINGCPMLNEADGLQIAAAAGLTAFGFMTGIKSLPALTFGIVMGMLIPKIFAPAFRLPRYIIFDYDPKSGAIKPVARAPA